MEQDAITGIGNNVTIEYENMDFGEKGFSRITICGCSHIEMNTIHIRFLNEKESINQIVGFPYSEDYMKKTFELQPIFGHNRSNLIFMLGSKYDLRWFRFE